MRKGQLKTHINCKDCGISKEREQMVHSKEKRPIRLCLECKEIRNNKERKVSEKPRDYHNPPLESERNLAVRRKVFLDNSPLFKSLEAEKTEAIEDCLIISFDEKSKVLLFPTYSLYEHDAFGRNREEIRQHLNTIKSILKGVM